MSDLQLGLAILGLIVIAGVVAFNWWQERQLHTRAERGLHRPDEDVLLGPPAAVPAPRHPQTRIEPQLETSVSTPGLVVTVDGPNPALDYIAEIRAGEVIPHTAIADLASSLGQAGRRFVLAG